MVGLTGAGHMDLGRALAGSRPILDGEALLDGRPYRPRLARRGRRRGHRLRHQQPPGGGLRPELTVRENFLANPRADSRSRAGAGSARRRERAKATALVETVRRTPADSEAPIATLSGGNQQKVMIGRWLRLSRRVADPGGADRGSRRRRQGGDLPPARRRARPRTRGPPHLHRLRGGRRRVSPRPGLRTGPRDRRTQRRRPHRHRTHPRRVGHAGADRNGGQLMATETESARPQADHGESPQEDGDGARKERAEQPPAAPTRARAPAPSPPGCAAATSSAPTASSASTVLLFLVFSLALPDTFPTMDNASSILSNQSIPAILALGAMIPIVTGKFDLSVGYGLGFAHVLAHAAHRRTAAGPGRSPASSSSSAAAIVGVLNGLLVEFARIDSFIATLGTGSLLYACTGWITDGARIVPGPDGLPAGLHRPVRLHVPRPAGPRLLRPRARRGALAAAGAPAARPLPVRHRLQRPRRRPRRHPHPPVRHLRLRRVRTRRRLRGRPARRPAADRQPERRHGLPAARLRRRPARLHRHQTGPRQRRRHRRRRRRPRHRPGRHRAARRRVLGDLPVQRRHAAPRGRPGRLLRPPPAARRRQRHPPFTVRARGGTARSTLLPRSAPRGVRHRRVHDDAPRTP